MKKIAVFQTCNDAKTMAGLFFACKVPFKEMERQINELVKTELTKYTDFLVDNGYCDSDVYNDGGSMKGKSAIDLFMHPELRDK